jgi:multiple sugar transport system ATP-binding protein
MASLKLSNLDKVFPSGERALYDVNLEVRDGEFLVILGGENSGKSTVLRLIAGLDTESDGKVFIDGKDVTDSDPKDRDIAMVFKSATIYPTMNVFDNLAYSLKMRKAPAALVNERVKVVSAVLGLDEVLYRKPKTLTSAQKQRVALGRAIVREPRVYLLDDPLSGLDDKLRRELLSVIINLQARMKATFVYATKNVNEAMTMGTRIAVMKNGFLQQSDTPANLYDYPANEYVAFLVGAPTINFIRDAEIVAGENGYLAQFKGGEIALPESIVKRFENIAAYAGSGKRVTLGIRPEDAKSGDGEIKGKVVKAESGANYAECEIAPDISFTFAADKEYAAGAEICLSLDKDRLHIFDAETRLTLLARDAGYAESGLPDTHFKPLGFVEEESIYYGSKAAKAQNKRK